MSHSQALQLFSCNTCLLLEAKQVGLVENMWLYPLFTSPFHPHQPTQFKHESRWRTAAYKYSEKSRQGKNFAKTFD